MSGGAARRHIERYGHDVVLINYTLGGEDDYGDATLIATSSTIKAIRVMGDYPENEMNEGGATPTNRATFHVKDTVTLYDGSSTQPSAIVDDGATFSVQEADDQRNGQITVKTERNGP